MCREAQGSVLCMRIMFWQRERLRTADKRIKCGIRLSVLVLIAHPTVLL